MCQENEFSLNQFQPCKKCVEGGICLNGILFNQQGSIKKIIKLLLEINIFNFKDIGKQQIL